MNTLEYIYTLNGLLDSKSVSILKFTDVTTSGTTGVNTTGTSASIKEIPYVYDKYKLDQIFL